MSAKGIIRAFPSACIDDEHGGMALLEWFAGQALAGEIVVLEADWSPEQVAKRAFEIAHAMMAECAKGKLVTVPTEAQVLRAIDSCGGTHGDPNSAYVKGYNDALAAAEREVKRLYARVEGRAP